MAWTKFEICSRALNEIGESSIESFEDGTNRSARCADLWPMYSEYLLSIYDWYFIRTKAQLGKLVTTPVNEYKYEFQLPGDYLRLRAVYDNSGVKAYPILDWDLFGDRIYANVENLWIDYERYVIAEGWPTWFAEFAVIALAAKLGKHFPVAQEKIDRLHQEAWGLPSDNGNGGLFGFAKNLDSKMRPSEPFMEAELISARFFS